MKVLNVVGARPNFIKVAPVHDAMVREGVFEPVLVHTGQHFDRQMSDIFFRQLGLPEPKVYLGIGGGTHAQQTARIMIAFEEVLVDQKPDLVLVVGDVNSTLACSLVAAKCHVPVAHVEAGLRSWDRRMPEEINRILTDKLSEYLFVTEESGIANLRAEGVPEEKIYFTGNVMIDSLMRYRQEAARLPVLENLGLSTRGYIVMTMHRPSNVDRENTLRKLVHLIMMISSLQPVVFPMHPRTRKQLDLLNLSHSLSRNQRVILTEPMGYLEFVRLMDNASVVVTDSGGVQEETTYLQVPCLTLRENTERPVTINLGTNELIPLDARKVANRVSEILNGKKPTGQIPPLWDGQSAKRIIDVLVPKPPLGQNQKKDI
jgi:UDP-N-acetylglucosamine 2-epimerase (non-hydrolysing)